MFTDQKAGTSRSEAAIVRFSGEHGTRLTADDRSAYEVQQLLGQGGFADVYLVTDTRHHQPFALKLLRMWEIQPNERKEVLNRFNREYECSRIDSPYLIHSHSQGRHHGNPFFTMDYCENGSLRQRIGKQTDPAALHRVAVDTLKGLSDLHKQGVIHRDLKPENILFNKQDASLLTDFGISGFLKSRMTIRNWLGHVKAIVGTLVYMPPEQLDAARAYTSMGPVTDIFAYGVLVFEMLTGGFFPFGDDAEQNEREYVDRVRKGQWINLDKMADRIPAVWQEVIRGCLQADMGRRYQHTDDILKVLGTRVSGKIGGLPATGADRTAQGAVLRVMSGAQHGHAYPLAEMIAGKGENLLTLGWYDLNHPKINDVEIVEEFTSYISRFHATVEYSVTSHTWYLRDGQWLKKNGKFDWYKSTNGVLLNSQRVDENGLPLHPGDIITVGDTTLKFEA
jgi:serine/threonine protein kinase